MKYIESKSNKLVKDWKKLHTVKGRRQQAAYLIEGHHLLEEAINSKCPISDIMVVDPSLLTFDLDDDWQVFIINPDIAKEIRQTETDQGIFAVIQSQEHDYQLEPLLGNGQRFLLMDRIQDPGNLGTIIRSGDAAGFDAIIVGQGSVDIYNSKVIRSTQGSLWHIPIINGNLRTIIPQLQAGGIIVYGAALELDSINYRDIDRNQALAFVIGNEGQGLAKELMSLADHLVHIPMPGKAESLNAAIAASILMFHSLL